MFIWGTERILSSTTWGTGTGLYNKR